MLRSEVSSLPCSSSQLWHRRIPTLARWTGAQQTTKVSFTLIAQDFSSNIENLLTYEEQEVSPLHMSAGPRSTKAMADAALALLPDTYITSLKGTAAFEKFKDAGEAPKVILASTKARATPLYKSLSLSFKGRLSFALVSHICEPHL